MEMALRPMSISQVLDRTFYLYRKHFVLFAGIAVVTPTLKLLALLAQLGMFGNIVMPATPDAITPQFMQAILIRWIVATVMAFLVYLVGTSLAASATAYAVSMVHLGKPTTIGEAYRKIRPKLGRIMGLICVVALYTFGPLFAAYALFLLVTLGGLAASTASRGGNAGLALVMAGLMLGLVLVLGAFVWIFFALCRYSLAVPACIVEDLPVAYSIRRSTFLTNGAKWGILLIIILTAIIGVSLAGVLQFPVFVALGSALTKGKPAISTGLTIWSYIADFLSTALAGPIAAVALAVVYYDQRVRKEAFDLHLMMEAVGQAATPPPPAPAAPTAAAPPPPAIG